MMGQIVAALRRQIAKPFEAEPEAVNCHHNDVTREHHFGENVLVTRKAALQAAKGALGIIRARWAPRALSCAGWAIPRASTAAATVPATCDVAHRGAETGHA